MDNMDFFLHDYAPVTTHMAFLQIPFETLKSYLSQREYDLAQFWEAPMSPQIISANGELDYKLKQMLPLMVNYNKTLISTTQSSWCVYLNNSILGDIHSQPQWISDELGIHGISIVMVNDIPGKQLGSMQFVYRNATQAKLISSNCDSVHKSHQVSGRMIMAHHENRWEFETWGEPFPFEELERYEAKRIKDRLTPDMIGRYCKHLGIDLFNPEFYTGEACILETYAHPDTEKVWQFPNLP